MTDSVAELKAELERVRAERDELKRALSEAEVYRLAVQHAPIGMMCTSITSGRYVFSNASHAGFLGYTPEEIVASDPHRRWTEITHPDDLKRELADHERLARGEITRFQSERRCVRRDGEVRWAHVTVAGVRGEDGRLAYIFVYFVDLHEQRKAVEAREQLEAQLRQSQKLEALGRLAGGVAHDFNNRLLIIMGYAEALRNGLPKDSVGAQHAGMVLDSAQRAAELTRQLLAFSRRQVLKPQAFDLNRAVEGMRKLLQRLIGEDIELVTSLGAKHLVFADPGQVEQVILNLAINARDAMPRGGRLRAETSDVTITAALREHLTPGAYVALTIEDTGTGIAPDVLPRIFEPFFTTKDVGSGTGLGLATVEGIVRQSGGSVRVDTSPNRGTRFVIHLPRAVAITPHPPAVRSDTPTQILHFETVLVCDDDDGVRTLLVDLLRIRAYQVLEASSGRQALEIARTSGARIDLLITDLVMPEMGGAELAEQLRADHPSLRILYVSGYTDNESLLSGALKDGELFLSKPFLPGELVRAVHALLHETRESREQVTERAYAPG